jgi:transposase
LDSFGRIGTFQWVTGNPNKKRGCPRSVGDLGSENADKGLSSERKDAGLAEFFVGGVTARSAADLAHVNRKTAAYFFHRLRQIIARQLEDSLPVEGLVEVDESYFGGVRKANAGAAKSRSSASSSAAAKFTP